MSVPSVKLPLISWLFIIPYNLGYSHISNSGLKNVYVKNSFDNLIKFFMIHKMYGCLCIILEEPNIVFVSTIIFSIADYLINTSTWRERKKSYILQCTSWKMLFLKLSLVENLRIKSLSLFKHQIFFNQHKSCVIVLWKCFPLVISLLSEWSIDSTAVFPCKTLAFSEKYILKEIQGMTHAVLYT